MISEKMWKFLINKGFRVNEPYMAEANVDIDDAGVEALSMYIPVMVIDKGKTAKKLACFDHIDALFDVRCEDDKQFINCIKDWYGTESDQKQTLIVYEDGRGYYIADCSSDYIDYDDVPDACTTVKKIFSSLAGITEEQLDKNPVCSKKLLAAESVLDGVDFHYEELCEFFEAARVA